MFLFSWPSSGLEPRRESPPKMCEAGVLRHDGPERLLNLQRGPGTGSAGLDPGIQSTRRADFGSTLSCHTNARLHFPALIKDALAASSLQAFLTRKLVESQKHTSEVSDQRIRMTSEVLTSIKLIKMYTWEKPFTKVIKGTEYLAFCSEPGMSWWTEPFTFWGFFHLLGLDLCSWENVLVIHFFILNFPDLRKKETKLLEKCGLIQSLTTVILFLAPSLSAVLLFLTHVGLRLKLTISVVSAGVLHFLPHIDREFYHVSFSSSCPLKDLEVL